MRPLLRSRSLTAFAGLLALASLSQGCRPSRPGAPPSTSNLRVISSSALSQRLVPCFALTGLTAVVEVKRTGLDQLTGTVRRADADAMSETPLTTYLLELSVDFVDVTGNTIHHEVQTTRINAAASSAVQASLVAAWDGIEKHADAFTVTPAGSLTLVGEVRLVRVNGLDRRIIAEQVLQSIPLEERIEVIAPTARCLEWERMGHTLASGRNGMVRLHGQDTPRAPAISWRDGRPLTLFGEMGVAAAPTILDRAQAVRVFLDRYPVLYGIGSSALTGTLAAVSDNADPDDTHRVVLRQSVVEQRGGRAVRLRTVDGKLNALFDTNEQLVFLTGRVLEDLPSQFPPAAIDAVRAASVVQQDLTAKGLNTGRSIDVVEEVIHGAAASEYTRAWLVEVGQGNAAAFPGESAGERSQSFGYTVSAVDGSILQISPRTVFSSMLVTARVNGYDETDAGPEASDLAMDTISQTGACELLWPHAQPARLAPELVDIRIETPGSPSGPFFLREDAAALNGVVERVEIGATGQEFSLPSAAAFSTPRPVADQRAVRAMTAYSQIQWFWAVVGEPLIPARNWDRLTVVVDHPDRGPCAPGSYQNNTIQLNNAYSNTILYTPAHEVFHHFDKQTAHLNVDGEQSFNPASMPGNLKEGAADFLMQFMTTFNPNNSAASGVRTLLCIFSTDFSECMSGGGGAFRSPRIVPYPRHRPIRVADGDTDLSPWPDCRIPTGRNPHCMVIRVPGNADIGTFSWAQSGFVPLDQRALIPQILQDAWETGSTAESGGHFAAAWPITVAKAFTMLNSDASYVEFRDMVIFATFLSANRGSWSMDMMLVVQDAFHRHGVDATLDQFCSAPSSSDECH